MVNYVIVIFVISRLLRLIKYYKVSLKIIFNWMNCHLFLLHIINKILNQFHAVSPKNMLKQLMNNTKKDEFFCTFKIDICLN